ncbi:MAG: efflux RND transporter periplasmic adaptor subunit [Paludibacter sp.]|nr:efflux RND transporter periplasmic adaptor subunit [Paludibacter sp.]
MIKYKHTIWLVSLILTIFLLPTSCKRQTETGINESHAKTPGNSIHLSEAQIQLANIKFTQVNEGAFNYNRIFTGVLKVNEESALNISSRATGRILKLFLKTVGETVNKGDSLYKIYCEEMVAAERQYFTLQSNNWNFNGKYEPSLALENKLLLLGMLPAQIEKLRKDGKILFEITIYSPVKGVVRSINVSEGQYVNSGQTLFELADGTKLWVEAEVQPTELENVKVGMQSIITVPDAGNKPIHSTISFINPSLEQGRNVTVIRSVIDNSNRKLYPGMLALMTIQSEKHRSVVAPASAVITSKNGSLVWIRNDDGSFSEKNVTTGIQSDDSVQILSGLTKSEYVVSSGAYLLNSELVLRRGTVAEVR